MQNLVSPGTGFDAWAEVYDTQPNPLLSLEQRVLIPLLPEVRGVDILDTGCGTGRWLAHFAECSPRRLTGIDASVEMLAVARRKIARDCELKLGNCAALPVQDESADLVLSSFVLSYIDDLETYANEIDRVLRPGGSFLLSDMHPETEILLGWKRSFTSHGAGMSVSSSHWPLPGIVEAFSRRGLKLVTTCEPTFGAEEQAIFAQNDRSASWSLVQAHPAIYVLKWRKSACAPRRRRFVSAGRGLLALRGARCATGPDQAEPLTLFLGNGRIESLSSPSYHDAASAEIDLRAQGYLVLPGLINAHDHLEFGLFPRLGNGPYQNAGQWAKDIHQTHADTIARLRRAPRSASILWGAIRNLLCGATTVCHHNPLSQEMLGLDFPVRVVRDYDWAHSCNFEPHPAERVAASNPNQPFIVHAAEGTDEQSANELFLLDEMRALSHRTLLVHGLACSAETIALINQRLATVILCPTSNQFLFHRCHPLESIRSLRSVLLGSDSPLTAAGDLLDEIRFAHRHIGIDAVTLYRMVTTLPARALRLHRGEGTLAPGAVADILVVRDAGVTPAEALVGMTIEQLELVIVGGRVQLVGPALIDQLPAPLTEKLEPLEVEGHIRWIGAPIRELMVAAEEVLGGTVKVAGKRMRYVSAA
jgi:cytosine/adenosine deaminase-related metal-dependent hydrolase/ubiquinone/menaquinone biosynthesis C-methylase UbiE